MRIILLSLAAAGALAGLAAPAAAQGGCQLSLRPEAERESFTSAGRAADAARLALLTRESGANFAAAASHLCSQGVLRRAQLAPFTKLLVRNAEGAAEPHVYDDAEQSPGALILEYAFTDSGAPASAAIEDAIRCWREPQREGCGEDVSP
jgi:hypothetical protein